jgi:hypothetical protein
MTARDPGTPASFEYGTLADPGVPAVLLLGETPITTTALGTYSLNETIYVPKADVVAHELAISWVRLAARLSLGTCRLPIPWNVRRRLWITHL